MKVIVIYLLLLAGTAHGQDSGYHPLPVQDAFIPFSFNAHLKKIPADLKEVAVFPFKGKHWIPTAVVAAASLLLIACDQPILDWVKDRSAAIGLRANTSYQVLWQVGHTKILKLPRNWNTALYQLGEGGSSILLASGLWVAGKIRCDSRAIQTAYDIAETFISTGISTQLIKRSTGRQSPFQSTRPGGEWNWFPSIGAYQRHTSSYDAFPSGHLTTLTATITVLCRNYPEKKWLKPVGIGVMALSAWAMMNTEVHWAGDYPLAIGMGYLAGKLTADRHRGRKATVVAPGL